MKIKDPCILCNKSIALGANSKIWLKGNNAYPLADGQCCDICNTKVVIQRAREFFIKQTTTE